MKKLTALIILTAAVLAIASGCNKKEESSVNKTPSAEITEAVTEETAEETAEPVPDCLTLTGTYGYSLILPDSIDSVNGDKITGSEYISNTDYVMVNSSTSKDNINVVVEPGKDKDTFDSYTKEVFQEQCEALGVFTNFKVNKYERTEIQGFDSIHIETSAESPDGDTFSQIQIIVNRAEKNADYCYTFTYTDFSNTLTDEYKKSIESIKMIDAEKSDDTVDELAGEPFTFEMCEGMTFDAPDGWTLTEGESDTPHLVSEDRAMFSSSKAEDVSNLLITISSGSDDNEEFLNYTQEDFEALLSGTYTEIESLSFEAVKVGKYDAFKYIYNVGGEDTEDLDLRQTMLFINCPDKEAGVMVCLTDFNQNNSDISDTLETLIKFS